MQLHFQVEDLDKDRLTVGYPSRYVIKQLCGANVRKAAHVTVRRLLILLLSKIRRKM